MTINKENLKNRLLAERSKLESELSSVGRKNPDNKEDWQALPPITESDPDQNVEADVMEGFEEAVSIEGELEQRLSEVNKALEKIDTNEYGICRVCKNEIEERRMEANPAATTCMEHLNDQ